MFTFIVIVVAGVYVGVAYVNKDAEGMDWSWPVAYVKSFFGE